MAEKKKKEHKEKPLEKWTIKELREEALKIPGVQGVHGLNKAELLAALREEKGIVDTGTKKKSEGVRVIKAKLKEAQKLREEKYQSSKSRVVDSLESVASDI
jgi:hypothetical protein